MATGIGDDGPGVVRHESDPTATTRSGNSLAQANGGSVSVARLVDIVVVLGALLMGAAGLASIFAPQVFLTAVGVSGVPINAGTEIFASYTGARTWRRGPSLANALDCTLDLVAQRWPAAPGPFLVAVLYLAVAVWLIRQDRKRAATE